MVSTSIWLVSFKDKRNLVEHIYTGRQPCEEGDGTGFATANPKNTRRLQETRGGEDGSSVRGLGSWPCQHLDFKLLVSRTMRQYISVVFSPGLQVLCSRSPRKIIILPSFLLLSYLLSFLLPYSLETIASAPWLPLLHIFWLTLRSHRLKTKFMISHLSFHLDILQTFEIQHI